MDKVTLAKAKRLEEDIRQMKCAVTYYKNGRWSSWETNDRASSFHFEFCKNWSHESFNRQDLPTWLNEKLMAVVEEQMLRCEQELENLGCEQTLGIPQDQGDWQPPHIYVDGERVVYDGIEYEYLKGKFIPTHKRSWLERWYNMLPFVIIIINISSISWIGIRYWETVRSYFDMIVTLDLVTVILFTVSVMIGIEKYIEGRKK